MPVAHDDEQVSTDGWTISSDDGDQLAGRLFPLVLEGLLDEAKVRELRVRESDDAVHLHKYRVTLRRTRSVLTAGAQVFPDEELELLLAMLSTLGDVSSPLRDLDVLLAGLDDGAGELPPQLVAGVEPLRDELERRHSEARQELLALLGSEFSQVLLRRWQTMASVYRVGGSDPGPDARRVAGEVVDELIARSFRRVRAQGRRAAPSDDVASWHRLRRRLKRFRYLVVQFQALYPAAAFDNLLRDVVRLQDGLGELQDQVAQAELLEDAGLALEGRPALAAGALIDRLVLETPDAASSARAAWERFDRPKVRRRVRDAVASRS